MRSVSYPYRSYHIATRALSLTIMTMALLTLVGWLLDLPLLTSLAPGFASMKVTTALGFLCAAASVLMLNTTGPESRITRLPPLIVTWLAAAAGLLGVGTLIGYAAGMEAKAPHPAWMSPSTAASFLLFALAAVTFVSEKRRVQRISECTILLMVWINGIVLVGYLYDEQSLYTFGPYVATPLPTAISSLLLGVALLCLRPDRGFMAVILSAEAGGLMLRRMVPLTFGMVIIVGWLHLIGVSTGWFNRTFGLTAAVGLNIGGFSYILWTVARSMSRADRERAESQIRLQLAKESADVGIQDYDVIQGTIRWDARVRELWGVGETEPITIQTFWNGVHPDDQPVTRAAVEQALDPAGDGRYHAEFRIVPRGDGQIRWVEATGRAIFERGQAIRLVGTVRDITRRKQSEEALRDSEARFRTLASAAPVGIFRTDPSGNCVYVNEWWLRIAGMTVEQALGNGWAERLYLDDRRIVLDTWMDAVVHQRTFSAEYRFVHPSGRVTWVLGHAVPEVGGGYVGITMDITERKQAEAGLRESESRFRSFFENAVVGAAQINSTGRFIHVNNRYGQITGYSLEELLNMSPLDLDHPDDIEADRKRISEFFREGSPYLFYEKRYVHKDGHIVWVRVTVAPIRDEHGVVQTTAAIIEDITEQKHAEDALRESELRFRTLVERMGDVFWISDPNEERLVYASRAFEDIWGRDLQQLYHRFETWIETIHEDDRERVKQDFFTNIYSGQYDSEYRVVRPDGTIRWIRDHGKPLGIGNLVAGVAEDITDRKQAEEALTEQKRLYQSVTDNASSALFIMDDRQQCRFMNPAAEKLTGYTLAETHGRPLHDVVHHTRPDGRPYPLEECPIDRALPEQNRMQGEEVFVHKDGYFYFVAFTASPIRDETGKPVGTIVEVQDISERKRSEAALRESEARFRTLADNMSQFAWIADATGAITWYNKRWFDYTGTTFDEMQGWGWTKVHHPDHVDRVVAKMQGAWDRGESWEDVFPLRGKDGGYRWFLSRAVPIHDLNGNLLQWFGTNTDVTKQRAAEESLRRLKDELEFRVVERTRELETSQARLRELASELSLAEQRERQRLATELHDHLQQMLVYGKMTIGQGKRRIADVPAATEVMTKVDEVLSDALTYSRTLVAELSPPVLRDHGLGAGLIWLGGQMKKYNQTVTVCATDEPEPQLPEAHRVLLFQSVRELLINASKHAGTAEATIRMKQQDEQLHVTVSDEGKGFDPAIITAGTGAPGGDISGKFGLFSIQERMRALGGSFIIRSGPGLGTTATLALPLSRNAERTVPSPEVPRSDSALGQQPTLEKHSVTRVLLVDDHAMVRQGLRSVLDAYDDLHVVAEARDGAEAVKLVEDLRPHVVVMDINMPGMNGIDATAHIKTHWPQTTVIGISINTGDGNWDAMKRAGAATVLPKESAVDQLHDAIVEEVGVSADT